MNAYRRTKSGGTLVTAAAVLFLAATATWAETTSKPAAAEVKADATTPALETLAASDVPKKETALSNIGTVAGNDVYVRSGFHQNYYPVTKLNKGDKVTVLGEEYGWLKILPPAGCYSLVEKVLIDKVDDQAGTANGEAMVYAGSNLNDRRYAKQVRLAKGDTVQLIGETSDGGFYKIQPPAGSTLWIKADLVDRGGKSEPKIEKVEPGELLAEAGGPATKPAAAPVAKGPSSTRPSTDVLAGKTAETQMDINAIEALVSAETTKPLNERSFEPIIARLRPLAGQSSDPVAQEYAKIRIRHLEEEIEIIKAVREIRESKEAAISAADRIAAERARIVVAPVAPMVDIAVRGEIRVSNIFDGLGGKPKRWRVVSPDDRTIAFIEVPQGSPIDPVQYYGKYVGIRASAQQMMQSTSPPVPIYTVKEILVQDPMAARKAEMAVNKPPVVPAPASQPAASGRSSSPSAN